jgi:hypothetical protein
MVGSGKMEKAIKQKEKKDFIPPCLDNRRPNPAI